MESEEQEVEKLTRFETLTISVAYSTITVGPYTAQMIAGVIAD